MIGRIENKNGILFNGNNFKCVKKILDKNGCVASHNHPEEEIVFTVVKGKINLMLKNDNLEEKYELKSGDVLNFDGNNYISFTALEETEVVIVLIKK